MKNYISKSWLIALALFACLSSCQEEDFGYTADQVKVAKYDRIFEETFGKIDEKQDFSMASLVKAFTNEGLHGQIKINRIYFKKS